MAATLRPIMSRPAAAAFLLLIPFLLVLGSHSSDTFLVGRPVETLPPKPRLMPTRSSDSNLCGMFPVVSFAATMGFIAAAKAAVQRRYKGSYNLDTRMPCGEDIEMTPEEQETWLQEKSAELEALMPLTDQEFLDEVEELTWKWARHLLPFADKRRHETALHKRKVILKQKELFKTLRLWHPLALKYPSLLKRLDSGPPSSRENRDYRIHTEYLANEEKIANFTYADFLKSMDGLKFTGESWVLPKVDDVVECTIKSINDDGAFVEIDSCRVKSWAQIPTRLSSLLPVSSVREAGLEVGMSLSAAVVEEGARSVVPGDKDAVQYILSLQSLQLDSAWDKAIKSFNGEADPFWTVTVLGMAPWGASVMSKEGLVGMIPARDLGNKAGDVGMVGAEVKVAIEQIRIEKKDTVNPQMVADYPIVFTFSRALKLELAKTYSEGDVADAKVIGLFAGSVDIEIDGVPFNLRKVDLSGYSKAWEIAEVFSMDETIKVYCILADGDNGDFRWSTRALEEVPGAIVLNKAKVFENAEDTAKTFFEKQQIEKEKATQRVEGTVDLFEILADKDKAPKNTGSVSLDDIDGSDEDF